MPADPTDAPLDVDAETAVIARLLDPPDAHTLAELHAMIAGIPAERVDAAVTSLVIAGVIRGSHGRTLHATTALLRLDALGMIGL
jgi:hypothetical protein